nr:MAG TPA: hypothetical protein [Bacteriophage sp.]
MICHLTIPNLGIIIKTTKVTTTRHTNTGGDRKASPFSNAMLSIAMQL